MIMKLRDVIDTREGLCLVVGSTGCGLYAMLKALNKVESKIVSVEDPIEAVIPGVTQIPIQEDIGRTGCQRTMLPGLSSIMRYKVSEAFPLLRISRHWSKKRRPFHSCLASSLI